MHLVAYFGLAEYGITILQKADVDLQDSYGQTSLQWAASRGHQAVVELLVDAHADVEAEEDELGQTPLSWAAKGGHEMRVWSGYCLRLRQTLRRITIMTVGSRFPRQPSKGKRALVKLTNLGSSGWLSLRTVVLVLTVVQRPTSSSSPRCLIRFPS